jgi:hypothetical protein
MLINPRSALSPSRRLAERGDVGSVHLGNPTRRPLTRLGLVAGAAEQGAVSAGTINPGHFQILISTSPDVVGVRKLFAFGSGPGLNRRHCSGTDQPVISASSETRMWLTPDRDKALRN